MVPVSAGALAVAAHKMELGGKGVDRPGCVGAQGFCLFSDLWEPWKLWRDRVVRSVLFNILLTGCRETRPQKIKTESGRPWGMGESGDREGGCALGSEIEGEGWARWGLGLGE